MLRYSGQDILFREIPGEISLAFYITGCPHNCKGCHWTKYNIPNDQEQFDVLNISHIEDQLYKYSGFISNVLFFGGDWEPEILEQMAIFIKNYKLKTSLYTGLTMVELADSCITWNCWDYIKFGPWTGKPLSDKNTNQRLIDIKNNKDITHKFWRD